MSGSSEVELQIKVIDSGIGIPKADLPNIFKPNFKSSESTVLNKNTYGNGLALSICQCIVSHLNGRITVKSKFGKGSTFKVVLKTLKVNNNVSFHFYLQLRCPLTRRKFYAVD